MPARNTALRYGSVAMALHWLIAALIVANLAGGFYVANIVDDADPMHFTLMQLHKSVGLTILTLSVLRVLWRLINPIPPLPAGMGFGLRFAARATHFLLYFFILAVPLAGWAWVSSSPLGVPTVYFGLFQWPHIAFLAELPRQAKAANSHLFHSVHVYLAYSMLALLVLHIGAALYHHYGRRDEVLKRMMPGAKLESPT
jgi:cytochrome b561